MRRWEGNGEHDKSVKLGRFKDKNELFPLIEGWSVV